MLLCYCGCVNLVGRDATGRRASFILRPMVRAGSETFWARADLRPGLAVAASQMRSFNQAIAETVFDRTTKNSSAGLKDRPADLGAPPALLGRVIWPDEIVLAKGSLDRQGVLRDVRCQRTVGKIDVGVRALVHEGGEFNGRHDARSNPANSSLGSCPRSLPPGRNLYPRLSLHP